MNIEELMLATSNNNSTDALDKLNDYIFLFTKMTRAQIGKLRAPHKPILLLSIMNLIAKGVIVDNKIHLTNDLIVEFQTLWKQFVDGDTTPSANSNALEVELRINDVPKYPFKCSIDKPYFHLQSEPFWRLVKSEQWQERRNYYSINILTRYFQYAIIDKSLFELMQNATARQTMTKCLTQMI